MKSMINAQATPYIYIHDIPNHLASSVTIAKIVKDLGFPINEPVQWKLQRAAIERFDKNALIKAVIKCTPEQYNEVAAKMKYFSIPENRGEGMDFNWECRTLPFDRDLIGNKRDETNRL